MADAKVADSTHIDESIESGRGANETVVVASEALRRYEQYQHSLTKKQAFREEWKPILWCMMTCILE